MYGLLKSTAERLGIKVPYTVISNEISGINAFATGTDEKPFIVFSNLVPKLLGREELQFIIAHECGHIAMEHMVYHTADSLAKVMGGYNDLCDYGRYLLTSANPDAPYIDRLQSFLQFRENAVAEEESRRCGGLRKDYKKVKDTTGWETNYVKLSTDIMKKFLRDIYQEAREATGKYFTAREYPECYPLPVMSEENVWDKMDWGTGFTETDEHYGGMLAARFLFKMGDASMASVLGILNLMGEKSKGELLCGLANLYCREILSALNGLLKKDEMGSILGLRSGLRGCVNEGCLFGIHT